MTELLLDAADVVVRRRRCRDPRWPAAAQQGIRYPADPPTVEEIVAVMRTAGDGGPHGRRLRGLLVVLWRAGLRIHEALALSESDLDRRRGSLLVRRGKGGRRREVRMDEGRGSGLTPVEAVRLELPVGRCAASLAVRRAGGSGRPPPRAPTRAAPRRRPAYVDGPRRTGSVTRMRSRWPTKACR